MPGKQAKLLTTPMLQRLLTHIHRHSDQPERDRAIILLSAKAGLRACEIAGLDWSMVLDSNSRVGATLNIHDSIAKKGGGRRLPMHADLKRALQLLLQRCEGVGPVIRSRRGGSMRPNSIVNWFVALYSECGFEGCSSHSGRRTFITSAARVVARTGGSLRDVQLLAGHRSIETTQAYIEGDTKAQRRLISMI